MTQKLHGAVAQGFTQQNLRKLLVNNEVWQVLWWRPEPFELWLESYPNAESREGVTPELEQIAEDDMASRLSPLSAWDAPEIDPPIHLLIDRWCERRALAPLRFILNGWPHNGLTDGIAELRDALDKVRAFARDDIAPTESELVHLLVNRIDRVLERR